MPRGEHLKKYAWPKKGVDPEYDEKRRQWGLEGSKKAAALKKHINRNLLWAEGAAAYYSQKPDAFVEQLMKLDNIIETSNNEKNVMEAMKMKSSMLGFGPGAAAAQDLPEEESDRKSKDDIIAELKAAGIVVEEEDKDAGE